jgi:L-alanine-DL-glutamate epimerase-like enolase superfamily enzyme
VKIERLSATAVRIPLRQATRMSTRLLDKRDYLLVRVHADEGDEVGEGYSYAGTGGGQILARIVEELLAPVVTASDVGGIVGLWEQMYQETLLAGRRGAVLRAMSAVDIALWDLAAKRAGLPLATFLGGATKPVPAYASGGYYRASDMSAAGAVAQEVASDRRRGFRDHKIKVGGLPPDQDAERVAAALDQIAGHGRLALDANNAYRDVHEAQRAIRIFERTAGSQGLWWVEEPLSPDDVEGHAALARRFETPIATGEIAQTRFEFRPLLGTDDRLILQPDVGVIGGVTEWMRVVRAAETFGVPVAPHWHANVHVHLAAASSNCLAIEHFALDKDIYNFEELLCTDSRLRVADGSAHISSRPGLGIELDPAAVEHYRLREVAR